MGIWGQKGQFWKFKAKITKTLKIIKKAQGTLFPPFRVLANCKDLEKRNQQNSRRAVTNGKQMNDIARYGQI